jgi:two-component system, OmpR family, phosphate regulon sensor histidine kinase PhoR
MAFRTRTPKDVALISSVILTAIASLMYFITFFFLEKEFEWKWLIMFLAIGFTVSYLVIYYFTEVFIYKKIKILYKTIHSVKTLSDGKLRVQMSQEVLEDVNTEVAKWADEKIKEVRELASKDNYRREFIGNLAHELKTPLFNIQGYIDTLIESDLDDGTLTRKFLTKASNSCERLATLIQDLDQITSIESGNFPLTYERFDITQLAREVIESLENKSAEKNIHLTLRNPNERNILVTADRNRMQQVFTNILVNSINYGKENGHTVIHFFDMGESQLVEISDDGIGIGQEHLPRLFERFYRVDKSRARHEGGSGLGLSICKHIIDQHNQSISVRSTEGIGSTFHFTIKKA